MKNMGHRGALLALAASFALTACALAPTVGGKPVFTDAEALNTPLGGLERTGSTSEIISVTGMPFSKALKAEIGRGMEETNATQMTILNSQPIQRGDILGASLWLKGQAGQGPARLEVMFEKSTDPWTKSVTRSVISARQPSEWRKTAFLFASADTYGPGQAMFSLRFALAKQTVVVGGISLVNYGQGKPLDQLQEELAAAQNLPPLTITVKRSKLLQKTAGMGGNFCQPRYGSSEPMDGVGRRTLQGLKVSHARIGLPLNHWTPAKNEYKMEGPALAAMDAMKILGDKGIPVIASIWEGPSWLLPGPSEGMGRVLAPNKYGEAIEAIGQWMVSAKKRTGYEPAYFSFNEPDYGVNFKFTPQTQESFIRQAAPAWRAKGLKTKFLIGDTANGAALPPYVEHLMAQKDLLPLLGPIAFHNWDALGATKESYERIAALGVKHSKEIWCTEGGWDAQLWQRPGAWESWENALNTARSYARTYRLTGSSRLDYWTYQDNYTLVDPKTLVPHPVFHVMRLMQDVVAPGGRVVAADYDDEEIELLAVAHPQGAALLLANSGGRRLLSVKGLAPGASLTVTTMTPDGKKSVVKVKASGQGALSLTLPTRGVLTAVP